MFIIQQFYSGSFTHACECLDIKPFASLKSNGMAVRPHAHVTTIFPNPKR